MKGMVMRTTLGIICLMVGWVLMGVAQPVNRGQVTIQQIQGVHVDSLKKIDSLHSVANLTFTQINTVGHWLDDGPFFNSRITPNVRDTVTFEGVLMSVARVITAGGRRSFYIQDVNGGMWSGLNILTTDSVASDAFVAGIDTGFVLRVTGTVEEFPTTSITGFTEVFITKAVDVLDILPSRPEPVLKKISDFNIGPTTSTGRGQFESGEPWEGVYVEFRDVFIHSRVRSGDRWTVILRDSAGNQLTMADVSGYYRNDALSLDKSYAPPFVNSRINIRGVIAGVAAGYAIIPMYPNDITVLESPPQVALSSRSPVIPTSSQGMVARALVRAIDLDPGVIIDSAKVFYRVGSGSYDSLRMSSIGSDIWEGTIPAQSEGSLVRFFFRGYDSKRRTTQEPFDSAAAQFFYTVRNATPVPVRDVQYTPYTNGNSGYLGLQVSVRGVVTANATDIPGTQGLSGNTDTPKRTYIQDGTNPWSGIWIAGGVIVDTLKRGDDVTVTGTVEETPLGSASINTRIVASSLTRHAQNATIPEPLALTVNQIGGTNMSDLTREQYEGMLVRIDSVTIQISTTTQQTFREIPVRDPGASVNLIFDKDGGHRYSNNAADTLRGYTIVKAGDKFTRLTGIYHPSFSAWKILPRKNEDAPGYTPVTSVATVGQYPEVYSLDQNYPNPFNPTTTIRFNIPTTDRVTLSVYNILGQVVATLAEGVYSPGEYSVQFDAARFSSGVYFYRLHAGSFIQIKKMVVLK
jgi:hypothetical protein